MANSSIPKVMERLETPQMPKQREVDHNQCNKLVDIAADGVVESTVVPIVEHVTNVLPPKHDVVVESTILPTVEHVTPVLLPEPAVMEASKNMDENRILLTPSILKLDSHLHDQTTQVQKQVTNSPLFHSIDGSSDTNGAPITHQIQGRNNKQNKMTVGLKNKRRKKNPKLQLVDESSSSTGPYGGRCTRRSDEGVESQYVRSPYIAIASNKRKAIPKKPTQTMLDLNAADSSLDTKDDKFDQSLNLLGKLLGANFDAIESSTARIVRPCPLSAEEKILKEYCFDKDLEDSLIRWERFRLLVDLVKDLSNSKYIDVMDRLDTYKERYVRLRKAKRKKKD
ncbi:hypothetical protein LOK49_LG01G02743 [Camellia lanceoleosa]|uniref:Uncharacterized protein n=1 Tax=Camellia lanceoleosa TaxID=1840588 RepID=A0ACC0J2F7_9ERIC|nr:hypothetical protein LOK49_LG01G02743 [Camellia lanceoleosa]